MTKLSLNVTIFSALLALSACRSDEKRVAPPTSPAPPAPAAQPAPMPEQAAQPQPALQRITVTGVWLDPSIASACGISPPKVFFEYDSSGVQRGDLDTLNAVANCLSTGPLRGQALQVVGHTDPRGADEYNKQLGKSRADSVAEYLTNRGVERGKLNIDTNGERGANGTDERGWAYDRRVDIKLAK